MIDEVVSRDEWSAGFLLLVAAELERGRRDGALTSAEAQQVGGRILVLLEQALDVPSERWGTLVRAVGRPAPATGDRAGRPARDGRVGRSPGRARRTLL